MNKLELNMVKKKYLEIVFVILVYILLQKFKQDMVQNCRFVISGFIVYVRVYVIFIFVVDKKLQYFIVNMKVRNWFRLKQVIKIREVCVYIKIKKYFFSIFLEMILNVCWFIYRNRLER